MNNFINMKTNEENRIKSDRQIPLTNVDIIYEVIGNMKGNIQSIDFNFINDTGSLITYTNDSGFNDFDKKALFGKNVSGNNNNTAGFNGHGIKLSLDRILPENEYSTVYSINDRKKCKIGHFQYENWCDFDEDDERIINEYKSGSLFIIPLSDEYSELFKEEQEYLKKACLKYLNKLCNTNEDFKFLWNKQVESIPLIFPDENSITIEYSIGYDTEKDVLNKKHKLPLIIKMERNNKDNLLNGYYKIQNKKNVKHEIKYNFKKKDGGKLKLNILKENNSNYKNSIIDGCHLYINNRNINYNGITKCLGGRTGGDSGTFGTGENSEYGGHPIFEIYLNKNNIQFFLPPDKSNIKPTNNGEKILYFIKNKAKDLFKSEPDTPPTPPASTPPAPAPTPPAPTPPASTPPAPTPTPSAPTPLLQQGPDIPLQQQGLNIPLQQQEPDIPLQRNIRDQLKTEIWFRAFGDKFFGKCFCCKRKLQTNWKRNSGEIQFGHIIPWSEIEENEWENILPICRACNGHMNNTNMDEWMQIERPADLDNYNEMKNNYLNSEYLN